MADNRDDDPILYAPELSKLLGGVPLGTIRYWEHTGYGPKSFKLGRRRAWRKSEVQRWLEAHENASATA